MSGLKTKEINNGDEYDYYLNEKEEDISFCSDNVNQKQNEEEKKGENLNINKGFSKKDEINDVNLNKTFSYNLINKDKNNNFIFHNNEKTYNNSQIDFFLYNTRKYLKDNIKYNNILFRFK